MRRTSHQLSTAAATHINNFVTRDHTPPDEFRRVGQEQLSAYPSVELRTNRVESVAGERGAFLVGLAGGSVRTRRILLCTGMLDEVLPIEGFAELWGHAIFQCPYCHGWEVQDRAWGFLVSPAHAERFFLFAMQARAWTDRLVVFTNAMFDVETSVQAKLEAAGIRLEVSPITRLVARGRGDQGAARARPVPRRRAGKPGGSQPRPRPDRSASAAAG